MPPTPPEKDRPDGIWPDEAIIRPPIEVLEEDGMAHPLSQAAEPAAPARPPDAQTTGDVQWLEEEDGAEVLQDLAAAAGAFTARVDWGPWGPGRVVLGWAHPVFTSDSRVFVSISGDPRTS